MSANLLTYLSVLARRKWVMLPAIIITPLVAVALNMQKPAVYEATAQVFLNRLNLAASISGVAPESASDAERRGNTEANLARAPEVASRAVKAAGIEDWNAYDLLGASDVASDPGADVLYFTVRGRDPTRAQGLATAYAEQFVKFRTELEVAAAERALKNVQQRLNRLSAAGQASSPLYADLVEKKNQLEWIIALQTSDASVVRPADSAGQIEPNSPTRSAALGLGLGIALAIALAFLADALDTRVKTVEELEDGLRGLPILGRVPDPAKEVNEGDIAMLTDPGSRYAESIRMLRVRLALGTTELQPRLIMVTSANPREGKSTTAANLAVALAQGGRKVVLCDLDARRPTLDRLFKLPAQPGLTDVVIDNADLEDALTVVPIPPKPYWGRDGSRNGRARGVLEVLTLGHPPAEPGEFTGSERVAEILESLRGRADVVLIDTPAILSVGDAMTIAGTVDAVMVVARFQLMPRSRLKELARVLATFPATPLGIVATGAAFGDRYRDDWYYQYPELLSEQRESIQR
jgi:Mrp family chromosome partitioning ATPase/capsular polysaccharide biosynthesis protein